jgi:hypothetical protein
MALQLPKSEKLIVSLLMAVSHNDTIVPHNEYGLVITLLDGWQKYTSGEIDFQGLMLGALLYPLDRIQSIQQVQTTYSSPSLRNSTAIVSTQAIIQVKPFTMEESLTSEGSPPSSQKQPSSQPRPNSQISSPAQALSSGRQPTAFRWVLGCWGTSCCTLSRESVCRWAYRWNKEGCTGTRGSAWLKLKKIKA